MPTTLVSGGSGYVGRFIVEGLLAAGHDVVVGGRRRPPPGFFSAPVRFVEMSLEPGASDAAHFESVDIFVHAAFDHLPGRYRGGEGDDPEGFVRRNRDGSIAMFEAAKACGVKRVVFLSSRAVYGSKPAGQVLAEETEPTPETLYGQVKLACETHLPAMAGSSFATVALRVTGVYGPAGPGGEDKWTALIRDWLAGKPIEPRAGSEVHGEDVAKAVLVASSAAARALTLNVSDIVVDRHDLLSIVRQETGRALTLPDRADASALNVMATERLRALGWAPGGVPLLEETVRNLARRAVEA